MEAVVGDARSLALPDADFDVVLLLGPLCHLQDGADRLEAPREARRVLVPGGILCAAMSRLSAVSRIVLSRRFADLPGDASIELLTTGMSGTELDPTEGALPEGHRHSARELEDRGRGRACGTRDVTVVGVEVCRRAGNGTAFTRR
ncbi:methyltransferase domain-containing protein [Microbacterium betulae]|uniref:Methyltransferase domain-containing protein n=1 Tax=Microbacterium betulae TaxID=2981139 RepID=A0AA97I6X3_9MICO|nr:methyltransferase domain-containing protein [Microbacterium sp. AB]WOF23072.1 methyltransferase domain-containing protein [Microbacterium sp. AB]